MLPSEDPGSWFEAVTNKLATLLDGLTTKLQFLTASSIRNSPSGLINRFTGVGERFRTDSWGCVASLSDSKILDPAVYSFVFT
jgi:hypothetical protein